MGVRRISGPCQRAGSLALVKRKGSDFSLRQSKSPCIHHKAVTRLHTEWAGTTCQVPIEDIGNRVRRASTIETKASKEMDHQMKRTPSLAAELLHRPTEPKNGAGNALKWAVSNASGTRAAKPRPSEPEPAILNIPEFSVAAKATPRAMLFRRSFRYSLCNAFHQPQPSRLDQFVILAKG